MVSMYTPGAGFAQSAYFDQQATALPGSLANASDVRLVDSAVVAADAPATGLLAGTGIVLSFIPNEERAGARAGINNVQAAPPTAESTAALFGGIAVRNQQMDSNTEGAACWFAGRMCNVVRADRVGGRVWVRLEHGSSAPGGKVHWIISDTTGHGKHIGAFSAEAISGDTVELTGALFRSEADATSETAVALVELGLNQ